MRDGVDEEKPETSPVCPPNIADAALAVLAPVEGLVAGLHAMMQRVHGLLLLGSQVLDDRREIKHMRRMMK